MLNIPKTIPHYLYAKSMQTRNFARCNFFHFFFTVKYANEIRMKKERMKTQRYISEGIQKQRRERAIDDCIHTLDFCGKKYRHKKKKKNIIYSLILLVMIFVLQFVPIMVKLWII